MRSRLDRGRRYSHISSIIVRHGLRPYLRGRGPGGRGRSSDQPAHPLRLAPEEAGTTFVKLGQMLSTRDDLLPPAFVTDLSRLQSQAPPAPWTEVEAVLREAYGRPVAEAFAQFDPEPVVVKVQRPGIRPVVERDLEVICRLARMLEERTRWAAALGVVELAEAFAASAHEELDFRTEARNPAVITRAWDGRPKDPEVRLPSAYEELSGERVLVLERLPGRHWRRRRAPWSGSVPGSTWWSRRREWSRSGWRVAGRRRYGRRSAASWPGHWPCCGGCRAGWTG